MFFLFICKLSYCDMLFSYLYCGMCFSIFELFYIVSFFSYVSCLILSIVACCFAYVSCFLIVAYVFFHI